MTQVNVSRRTLAKGMAWTVPAVAVAAAAPATAASGLTISPGAPTVGYAEEAYTPLNNAVSGGTGPYTWSAAPGSLPAGLHIDPATGAISGQPTAAGQSQVILQVKDANGATATAPLAITVGPNRAAVEAEMLRRLNLYRGKLTVVQADPFTIDASMQTLADNLAPKLAARGTGISLADHQASGTNGMKNENIGFTASTDPITDASFIAERITGIDVNGNRIPGVGWAGEPNGYSDYQNLINEGKQSEADEMFDGGANYPTPSGHRISLEDPNNTVIGLSYAYTGTGTYKKKDGTLLPHEVYGVADFK